MPCEWCGEHTTDYIVWKDKANADHYTHNNSYTDKLKAVFEKQYAAYCEYCEGKVQGELTYW